MSVNLLTATDVAVMSEVVNRREMGKKALTSMLFGGAPTLLTAETVLVDELTGTTGMAPMVEKDGKAVTFDRLGGQSYTIETPAINIKRPLTCNDVLLQRAAGQPILMTNGRDVYGEAAERQVAEDLTEMEEAIQNREEWMVSQLIQGEISYQVEGKASFTVTTAKPTGNTFTVDTLWDASDPTPLNDIKKAKRLVQPYSAPGFMAAVCGQEASDAITALVEAGEITSIKTDSGINAGMATLIENYQANGMLYLGTFGGIPFFEYAANFLSDADGVTSTPHIRTDYVEFLGSPTATTHKMYYGAIRDMEAIKNGLHIAKRFSTSDYDKDAGTYIAWLKSRPLPWFKRPDWNVSMKVT